MKHGANWDPNRLRSFYSENCQDLKLPKEKKKKKEADNEDSLRLEQ